MNHRNLKGNEREKKKRSLLQFEVLNEQNEQTDHASNQYSAHK